MKSLLPLLISLICFPVLAQEPSDDVELFSSSELEQFLMDYKIEIPEELFNRVESVIDDLPDEIKSQYQSLSRTRSEYSLPLLNLANRTTGIKELHDFITQSKDPMILFDNLFKKVRTGDMSAAEQLIELRNNYVLSLNQKRSIETQFAMFGIPKITTPSELVQILKPQDLIDWTGKDSPDFELTTTTGEKIQLKDLRGKFVVLHFWATWCGPCVGEMPEFAKAVEANAADDLVVISISADFDKDEFTDFLRENSPPGKHVLGEAGVGSKIIKSFHIRMYPSTLLIAPDGKVVSRGWRSIGEKKAEWIEANREKQD